MSKDPAVLFYTSDFLSGTFTMSNEQVGMYIRLLCYQHQKGKLSEKDMISICPSRDEEVWGKFDIKDGYYINNRMYEEAEKRKNFTESRKKNLASKKKTSHMDTHMDTHMVIHMENENENENNSLLKEGVIGGDLWETHKKQFWEDGPWQLKFCTIKHLAKAELDTWMAKFLDEIELRGEYKDKKELQRHFTNWFNLQKKSNGTRKASGAYELLEELRFEHQTASRNKTGDNGNQYDPWSANG